MSKLTQHFEDTEFTCPCGCKINNISLDLVKKLEKARQICNFPFVVTSGCRCESYNASLKSRGSVAGSAHLKGLAADIYAESMSHAMRIIDAALESGFIRIGVKSRYPYRRFVHLDIDSDKPSGLYTY